jgi:hypothetical protein
MQSVQEQLDFYLSVDRLLSAAEQVRRNRDRLLQSARSGDADHAPLKEDDERAASCSFKEDAR